MWEEEVHRSKEVFRNSGLRVIEYDFLANETVRNCVYHLLFI